MWSNMIQMMQDQKGTLQFKYVPLVEFVDNGSMQGQEENGL
jgi:hypothetical protein